MVAFFSLYFTFMYIYLRVLIDAFTLDVSHDRFLSDEVSGMKKKKKSKTLILFFFLIFLR